MSLEQPDLFRENEPVETEIMTEEGGAWEEQKERTMEEQIDDLKSRIVLEEDFPDCEECGGSGVCSKYCEASKMLSENKRLEREIEILKRQQEAS